MKRFFCLLFLGLWLFPSGALSQSANATISGGVTDSSGNFIPDAEVVIANDSTGVIYSSNTNGSGMYFVPILPPGHYHVQVSKRGFKTMIKPDVVLNVQSAVALNFALPVGATSESITVDADSSFLNTSNASVSTVVDRKFVENMPLNGRSFQDLISMTPGVSTQSPQTVASINNNGDFSVNGQRTESNYYSVDGVSANTSSGFPSGYAQSATGGTLASATALGTTQSLLSVDAMQEFRVQSSTYSAEFGRTPGGQFSLASRAGTNQLHGSLYEYLRNNYFDANNWFNNHYGTAQPALRQNDFGGTAGGPVFVPKFYDGRSRSFFFVSYEGLRLTQPQAASLQYVPSTALREDAPASLRPILNAFPTPTGVEAAIPCNNSTYACPAGQPLGSPVPSGVAPLLRSYTLPSRIDSTSVRLDHTLSPRLQAFFRFGDTPSATQTRTLSNVGDVTSSVLTYTLGVNSQISHNASNELRAGYSSSRSAITYSLDPFGGAVPVDLAQDMGIGGYANSFPTFYLYINGLGTASIQTESARNESRQWNIVDTTSLTLGKHQLRFGLDYRHIASPLYPTSPSVFAQFTSRASVVANSAALLSITKFNGATPLFHETGLYLQDEWRIAPTFSLSLGVRWEVNPPPSEANGNLPYTLLGDIGVPSSLSVAPHGTPLWRTTFHNFAPRIGFAWTAHDAIGWATIIRAGGGVFFDTNNQFATQGFRGLGFTAANNLYSAPLPATSTQLDFNITPAAPYRGSAVYGFPAHLQLPYTLQWSAAIEQGLGRSQSLTISYVAAAGRRLVGERLLIPGTLNPNLAATIYYFSGNLTSNYQSLQTRFQRSIAQGVQALASYTWSHSIDYGSTGQSLPFSRASSDYDLRNNFQGGISWDIKHSYTSAWTRALLDQWSLDGRVIARSGFPITLTGNLFLDPLGNYYYGGLNYNPGIPEYLYGAQYPGGWGLNPAAFRSNTSGTSNGNVPRNHYRGFDATQVNTAIRREFSLPDGMRVQFRAEAFNLLNHPIFGYIDPTLSSATFGQATKTLNQSLGTVS
ncbi:TonB-dependent receptor [Edaphobacter sp. HDX4]|uniref:TonB-dependent receptor n=1 Tax=Edaphobacter sp. HDX4 TaxID=2794064 RepID=UPI002FE6B9C8